MRRLLAWAALTAGGAGAAAACNALDGLDKSYETSDCFPSPSGACGDGSDDRTIGVADSGDGGDGGADGADAPAQDAPAPEAATCPELRWPVMLGSPIVPPWQIAGIDHEGTGEAGITPLQAQAINCAGTLIDGGDFAASASIVWGSGGEVAFDYEPEGGRWEGTLATAGYTGLVGFKSADGAHGYRLAVGTAITRDFVPFAIDWSTPGAALTQLAELYNAAAATFAPGTPTITTCAHEPQCRVFTSGSTLLVGFRPVHLYFEAAAGTTTLTPSKVALSAPLTWSNGDPQDQGFAILNVPFPFVYNALATDKHSLYLVPGAPGVPAERVDIDRPEPFTSPPTWTRSSMGLGGDAGLSADAGTAYSGACFGDPYLYFSPAADGLVARFDTSKPFEAAPSWDRFPTTQLSPPAASFGGAVVAGSRVVFPPSADGVIAAYDTTAPFSQAKSWQTFDLTTVDPRLKQLPAAAVADGYVYLAPHGQGAGFPGVAARWKVGPDLSKGWEIVDLGTLSLAAPGALAFSTAIYDGSRYLYFLPIAAVGPDGGAGASLLVQYDTAGAFAAAGSWDSRALDSPSRIGGWDGRYLYFERQTPGFPFLERFDSQAGLHDPNAISIINPPLGGGPGMGFVAIAFDGRYVYYVPDTAGLVLRLDAAFPPRGRDPAKLPFAL
jgi:hypothetical protein